LKPGKLLRYESQALLYDGKNVPQVCPSGYRKFLDLHNGVEGETSQRSNTAPGDRLKDLRTRRLFTVAQILCFGKDSGITACRWGISRFFVHLHEPLDLGDIFIFANDYYLSRSPEPRNKLRLVREPRLNELGVLLIDLVLVFLNGQNMRNLTVEQDGNILEGEPFGLDNQEIGDHQLADVQYDENDIDFPTDRGESDGIDWKINC